MVLNTSPIVRKSTIRTIIVDFQDDKTNPRVRESIKGTIYHLTGSRTIVKVESPNRQWITYQKNEMTIYYPESKTAFRFVFQYAISLPFFQAFVGIIDEDFGLSALGYSLEKYEKKDENLITFWKPPPLLTTALGTIVLEYRINKLVSSEVRNPQNKPMSRSIYASHFDYNGYSFPMDISTSFTGNSDLISEFVRFENPRFNLPFPIEVAELVIPPDVKVKEIRW